MIPPRHPSGRRRTLAWLGSLVWAGFIFVQSSRSDTGSFFSLFPAGTDKVVHGGVFFVLSALLALATGRPLLAALLATLYGASDELHQLLVPGRQADLLDLLADGVGSALGALSVAFAVRRGRPAPLQ